MTDIPEVTEALEFVREWLLRVPDESFEVWEEGLPVAAIVPDDDRYEQEGQRHLATLSDTIEKLTRERDWANVTIEAMHDMSTWDAEQETELASLRSLSEQEPPRVVSTEGTLGGAWRIDGHRISTELLADLHAAGDSIEAIADAYESIRPVDVAVAVAFEQGRAVGSEQYEAVVEAAKRLDYEVNLRHREKRVSDASRDFKAALSAREEAGQ